MSLKLVKLTKDYKEQLIEMLDEWYEFNNTHPEADTSPRAIFKPYYKTDFELYLSDINDVEKLIKKGYVPDSTLFLFDDEKNIFLGAINIRHYLNEKLLLTGGHIGDGIRPSQRRKGYATKIIKLGLDECKKLGIYRVLITCNAENIGSKKSIINNGGIKENEVIENNSIVERYWINLEK